MTRQEAIDYDNELKNKMMLAAENLGLDKKTGADIVNDYIIVIPDDERKGMIFLGNDAASYKFGNIRLDLKKAIAAGLELAASVNLPESFFNYLQMLIIGAFFIQKSTKQEIGKLEAYIVYRLHIRNAYEIGIQEETFLEDFKKWYQERQEKSLDATDIALLVKRLYQMKVLDIDDGKIYLKERVIGINNAKY